MFEKNKHVVKIVFEAPELFTYTIIDKVTPVFSEELPGELFFAIGEEHNNEHIFCVFFDDLRRVSRESLDRSIRMAPKMSRIVFVGLQDKTGADHLPPEHIANMTGERDVFEHRRIITYTELDLDSVDSIRHFMGFLLTITPPLHKLTLGTYNKIELEQQIPIFQFVCDQPLGDVAAYIYKSASIRELLSHYEKTAKPEQLVTLHKMNLSLAKAMLRNIINTPDQAALCGDSTVVSCFKQLVNSINGIIQNGQGLTDNDFDVFQQALLMIDSNKNLQSLMGIQDDEFSLPSDDQYLPLILNHMEKWFTDFNFLFRRLNNIRFTSYNDYISDCIERAVLKYRQSALYNTDTESLKINAESIYNFRRNIKKCDSRYRLCCLYITAIAYVKLRDPKYIKIINEDFNNLVGQRELQYVVEFMQALLSNPYDQELNLALFGYLVQHFYLNDIDPVNTDLKNCIDKYLERIFQYSRDHNLIHHIFDTVAENSDVDDSFLVLTMSHGANYELCLLMLEMGFSRTQLTYLLSDHCTEKEKTTYQVLRNNADALRALFTYSQHYIRQLEQQQASRAAQITLGIMTKPTSPSPDNVKDTIESPKAAY